MERHLSSFIRLTPQADVTKGLALTALVESRTARLRFTKGFGRRRNN
jgi:hypothetical protein